MSDTNRPLSRKKTVTGTAEVKKRGTGLGTGKVGNREADNKQTAFMAALIKGINKTGKSGR